MLSMLELSPKVKVKAKIKTMTLQGHQKLKDNHLGKKTCHFLTGGPLVIGVTLMPVRTPTAEKQYVDPPPTRGGTKFESFYIVDINRLLKRIHIRT